jgi:hypothetical protein
MSDIGARKQEGLKILEMGVIPDSIRWRLNELTAEQASYDDVPHFTDSVDACLSLPIPDGAMWTLRTGVSHDAILWTTLERNELGHFKDLGRADAEDLPFAMLAAWWQSQEGNYD